MKEFLKLDDKKLNSWNITLFFILAAYVFSVGLRFIYIGVVDKIKAFYWHGQLMINNPDGYYYAEGARDILDGLKTANYLSPVHNITSEVTAFVASFLHIPLDTVILYLPGFFGSLIVIPLILIGREIGSSFVGFLAALLGGIAWSYYHRTMFGYYDTDMLVVGLPLLAFWAVIWSLKNKDIRFFFVAPFIEIFMIQWHGGMFNVANGYLIMVFIYVLYLKFIKKEDVFYGSLFLLFLIIPLFNLDVLYKYGIVAVLNILLFAFKDNIKNIYKSYLIYIVFVFYLLSVAFPWIRDILHVGYITRSNEILVSNIHYFDVVNTIRETQQIDVNVFVHRISGSWIGFIVGVLGYLLLILRYPIMAISLPMAVLGFFALKGGLRFTIFAVPFMALGDAYVVYLIGKYVSRFFINEKVEKFSKYTIAMILMAVFIYPNYIQIKQYIMPTVLSKPEVKVLNKLKHIVPRDSYVLSWWDYGYPIRYYADTLTFIDGGLHTGNVDFPISFALTRPQLPSRNMAVLDLYFTQKHRKDGKRFDIVRDIMRMYHLKHINEVEPFLYHKIPLPKTHKDIYYALPLRMFNIFPTVSLFSSLNLKTGKVINHFYYNPGHFKIIAGNIVKFNNNVMIDLSKKAVILGNTVVPIKNFAITAMEKNGKIIKKVQKFHNSGLDVIFMKSYGKWLIVDDFYYHSTFFQLFIFDNTQGLFKQVINSPYVKVYKLIK